MRSKAQRKAKKSKIDLKQGSRGHFNVCCLFVYQQQRANPTRLLIEISRIYDIRRKQNE